MSYTQLPLFEPKSTWRPPDLGTLPSWRDAKRIGFDFETHDEFLTTLGPGVRRGAKVCGYSFAIEDGPKHYVPFAHEDPVDNLPEANALAYLCDNFKLFRGDIVGANLSYELDYLLELGCDVSGVHRWLDVQIAEPLIDSLAKSYRLDLISKKYGYGGKNEEALREAAATYRVDPKSGMWRMPARHVGAYAEDDAWQPLGIMRKQERVVEEDELERVFDMESRLMPLLVKMRRFGVLVDQDRLAKIEEWSLREEAAAFAIVRRETGIEIPVGASMNTTLIARAFRKAELPVGISDAGKDSIKTPIIEKMDHPVAQAVVRARRFAKLRTTFAASIREHMVNGRIHCTFNQLRRSSEFDDSEEGAAFGRLSSVDPNMQNQPGRDEETGPVWRSIFRPEPGCQWDTNDYSQQEPRWSFHFADLCKWRGERLPGAAEICDVFRNDPKADCYDPLASAADISRKLAKIIWLGRCYGMGGKKMCQVHLNLPTQMVAWSRSENRKVGIETEPELYRQLREAGANVWEDAGPEGMAIIDKVDNKLPFLKILAKLAKEKADERGYIITHSGRRCHFPLYNGKYEWTHVALNRLIQGSAADQTKEAMLALDDAGFLIQLQVHDEIDSSVESPEQAEAMAQVMRETIKMQVPVRVDVELGASWGESMKVGKPERPYVWNL